MLYRQNAYIFQPRCLGGFKWDFAKFMDFRSWMHLTIARIDVFMNWMPINNVLWNTQKENIVCSLRCWSILSTKCTAAFNLLEILCQTLFSPDENFLLRRENVSKCVLILIKITINIMTLFRCFKKRIYMINVSCFPRQ